MKYVYDSQTSEEMWSRNYAQSALWMEGAISYSEIKSHSIIFQGTKGSGVGDMAIDDITFFPSSYCNSTMVSTPTTSASTPSRITSPFTTNSYTWQPQSQYDCNFENGICSWQNDLTGDFIWTLGKPYNNYFSGFIIFISYRKPCIHSFLVLNLGPTTDHTYQNKSGSIIYIDVILFII